MTGKVVHFEVPYDDGDRARGFYSDVFGWEVMTIPEMDYTLVTTGPTDEHTGATEPGFINGGMFGRSDQFPSKGPNLLIEVESVDEALRRATEAGGTVVVERTAVADMGFSGYFADTEGNVIGLWENASQEG